MKLSWTVWWKWWGDSTQLLAGCRGGLWHHLLSHTNIQTFLLLYFNVSQAALIHFLSEWNHIWGNVNTQTCPCMPADGCAAAWRWRLSQHPPSCFSVWILLDVYSLTTSGYFVLILHFPMSKHSAHSANGWYDFFKWILYFSKCLTL